MTRYLSLIFFLMNIGCNDNPVKKNANTNSNKPSSVRYSDSNSRLRDFNLFHDISIPKSWKGVTNAEDRINILVTTEPETSVSTELNGVYKGYCVFNVKCYSDSTVIMTFLKEPSCNKHGDEYYWVFHRKTATTGSWNLIDNQTKSYTYIGDFEIYDF